MIEYRDVEFGKLPESVKRFIQMFFNQDPEAITGGWKKLDYEVKTNGLFIDVKVNPAEIIVVFGADGRLNGIVNIKE
jgi:hypothetical protein